MSLINQALRKAQQDRTPKTMQPDTDQSMSAEGTRPYRSQESGMKPGVVISLIVMVALLIGIIAGLSVVLFKGGDTSTAEAPQSISDTARESLQPLQSSAKIPVRSTPQSGKSEAALGVLDELRIAREDAEAKAATEAAAVEEAERIAIVEAKEAKRIAAAKAEEAARIAAAKPSQDIIKWLSESKVTGVRLSPAGNKVILNGKAFVVDETVHFGLGLKVLAIEEKRILFVDKVGKKYMKRL